MKLADLMYGHGEKFMCSLRGRYDPEHYPDAPHIQIGEMKCGCWIVVDGNNRVGLILKQTPEAVIADIPEKHLAIDSHGNWDDETMDWWNPCPESFRKVMNKRGIKKIPEPKNAIYGVIEREDEEDFFAATLAVKDGTTPASARGCSAQEAKDRLESKIKQILKCDSVPLVLIPLNALEDHRCGC